MSSNGNERTLLLSDGSSGLLGVDTGSLKFLMYQIYCTEYPMN